MFTIFDRSGLKKRANTSGYNPLSTNTSGASGDDILPAKTIFKIIAPDAERRDYITAVLSTENHARQIEDLPLLFTDIVEEKNSIIFKLNIPKIRSEIRNFLVDNCLISEDKADSFVEQLGKSKLCPSFQRLFSLKM